MEAYQLSHKVQKTINKNKGKKFPWWLTGKQLCSAGDDGLIHGSRRSPREGNGNSLQYCLGNLLDRGSWRATVHGFAESDKTEHTHLNRKSTDNILNLMSNTRVGSELPTQPPISPFFRCNLSQFCPELFCTLTHLGTCSGKALSSTCVSNWSKCHSISLSSECFRNRPVSQEVGLPVFLGKVSTFSYSYTKDNFPSLDTVVPGYYSETPASY